MRTFWDRSFCLSEKIKFWRNRLLKERTETVLMRRKRKAFGHGKSVVFRVPVFVAETFKQLFTRVWGESGKDRGYFTPHQVALAVVALGLRDAELLKPTEATSQSSSSFSSRAISRNDNNSDTNSIDVILGGLYLGRGIED